MRQIPLHGFQKAIGIVLDEVTSQRITAHILITDAHRNSVGRVHGGVLMALADCLGGIGALQSLQPGQRTATLESKTNFIGSDAGDELHGECTPVHLGSRTSVWTTRVTGGQGKLLSITTQTQIHLV
ncbi:PaaI family thioesterase [Mesorhizobium caraganae]|uniref:PaaI family thioesterase n=1 Tax=Mesorhizobium caraganae TaxID=483206 RepID=UPI00177D50FF|nr:PaaI family thioesterase [Mesorhizobium caraganae]